MSRMPRGRARGRGHGKKGPLRKPGEFQPPESISQDDEKPPVQTSDQTDVSVNVASDSQQIVQDVGIEKKVEKSNENVDNVLQRAVKNPVFIPSKVQGPVRFNPPTNSSWLASAVNAPVFVPGAFTSYEETPDERLKVIENFVNKKIQQLTEDPGLLDEISMSMANYLSAFIEVENDMTKLSDILFEKCVSEQNFQYTGSRLANFLDKNLVPKTLTQETQFRNIFLKRCSHANSQFQNEILTSPERAYNVAMFLGELLMNYKTNVGETIGKFVVVVSNIIEQLLACADRKLLICAGKLLKLTGSTLDQNDKLFTTVALLAHDPRVDKTAQILFSRVCELRRTDWGQNEIPQTVAYTNLNTYGAQGYSMYFPSLDGMLEEQAPNLPVYSEEEWNEYIPDGSSQDEAVTYDVATNNLANNDELSEEDLYRLMSMEQYGSYTPYATEDNWPSGGTGVVDDYGDDYETFLNQLP